MTESDHLSRISSAPTGLCERYSLPFFLPSLSQYPSHPIASSLRGAQYKVKGLTQIRVYQLWSACGSEIET